MIDNLINHSNIILVDSFYSLNFIDITVVFMLLKGQIALKEYFSTQHINFIFTRLMYLFQLLIKFLLLIFFVMIGFSLALNTYLDLSIRFFSKHVYSLAFITPLITLFILAFTILFIYSKNVLISLNHLFMKFHFLYFLFISLI